MADSDPANNLPAGYVPPKVWRNETENGGQFASINAPTAGARQDITLPIGEHPLQLYSLGTPNGQKVTVMLEELLAAGYDAEYDAWLIKIYTGEQFGSDFVKINPNSKIPAMMDYSQNPPLRLFESGSMLVYLAEKFGAFLPTDLRKRTETFNWLMWQMGSAPFVGGGFGHFYAYAPIKIEYAIDRYAMETKRQLDVLDKQLADNEFIIGDEITIADFAILPWYGSMMRSAYDAQEFLSVHEYRNVDRWVTQLHARKGVSRGLLVNAAGRPGGGIAERHSAKDLDDAIAAAAESAPA
ncbi:MULTISPECIES: glutathione-dependent disulfide-bond oxidoreductase [unclassified Sphingobium]|uniref:glutathione-dependent disulfide-bond oxidoreductase n=1 Tax=unclassified Sphingobium TaxID=2611147 RepID=UPI002224A450|nr:MULTISPECIES: glutathione-dependent disulfide-bond oxidoreductase [unclassified Sphingobium]MCW2349110.1 GST-like protein [Sphingobium sp. B12D2B]MCW2368239.1 GST-like protein [Sphingobium sp. B11D3D]